MRTRAESSSKSTHGTAIGGKFAQSPVLMTEVSECMDEKTDDYDARQLSEGAGRGDFSCNLIRGVKAPEESESGQQQDNDYDRRPGD